MGEGGSGIIGSASPSPKLVWAENREWRLGRLSLCNFKAGVILKPIQPFNHSTIQPFNHSELVVLMRELSLGTLMFVEKL